MAERMNIFPDDSFYYMTPALNIAKGLGPTADTITLTSGYHPLWMMILVILAKFTNLNKETFFTSVIICGIILHILSALLVFGVAVRFLPIPLAIGWALVYAMLLRGLLDAIGGTEAALLSFLISLLFWFETFEKRETLRAVVRGVLIGLLFLARTDTIFFAIGWMGFVVFYLLYCKDKKLKGFV